MRKMLVAGALSALMLGGCLSAPDVAGSGRAPSLAALQAMCGGSAVDYGTDAQGVYSAFLDAYIAQKRGKLPRSSTARSRLESRVNMRRLMLAVQRRRKARG